MNDGYIFDRVVQLSHELSEERMEASRWRGTATQLADTIIKYLRDTNPAANIPEWLYHHHWELFDALEKHSNRLYDNPDRWQRELGLDDI